MLRVTFRALCFILLLTLSFALFAAEITYQEKELEAKRLGDEFKAKTGFVGEFNYNLEDMSFRGLKGTFPDIVYNNEANEETQRALADNIIQKVLPLLHVPLEQFNFVSVDKLFRGEIIVEYLQKIDGISLSPYGGLSISFKGNGNPEVTVANYLAIVEDLSKHMTISKQQAIEIMLPLEKQNNQIHHNDIHARQMPPGAYLIYCQYIRNAVPYYRLIWRTYWEGYRVEVDAVTGEVMAHYSEVVD